MSDPLFQEMADTLTAHMDAVVAKIYAGPVSPWLNTESAASYLGLKTLALRNMRNAKTGPRYAKPTHKIVRYHIKDLDSFIESGAVDQ